MALFETIRQTKPRPAAALSTYFYYLPLHRCDLTLFHQPLPASWWNSARGGRRKPQKPRKRPRTAPSAPCKVRDFRNLYMELTMQSIVFLPEWKNLHNFSFKAFVCFCRYTLCGQTFLQRVSSQESSSIRHLHHAIFHLN